MTKGRLVMRVIVGGYLAYLGFDLISSSLREQPEHYIWFCLGGVLFFAIGALWLLLAVRTYIKEGPIEDEEADDEEPDQEEPDQEEPDQKEIVDDDAETKAEEE